MNWGVLAAINLYGCDSELIKNQKAIKKFIVGICRQIKMRRFGPAIIKRFGKEKLEGCSAMQLIETSSITLHFDEEKNRAFIDIFSCKNFNPKKAEKFSRDFFKASRSKMKILARR